VVYTDFVQAFILVSGFVCVTAMALHHDGGLAGLRQNVPPSYFSVFGVDSYPQFGNWAVGGMILTLVLSVIADPGRRMSMFGAETERGARWSMVVAGLIVIAFSVLIGITGMYARQLNPTLPDSESDKALLWLVIHVLPSWLAAFVVIAAASGIFSCANGNAMAISTFFVRHIYPLATGGKYPRRPLFAARILLVCAFVLCTTVALHAGTIVSYVTSFLPITMSGLAIVILMGRFWRRSTWQGAMAALIITPIITLIAKIYFPKEFWNNAVILAIPGFAAHFVVSLLTPRPTRTFQEVANTLTQERQNIEEKALGLSSEKSFSPKLSPENYEAS
jgi:SSS family solute:Na+ symporter